MKQVQTPKILNPTRHALVFFLISPLKRGGQFRKTPLSAQKAGFWLAAESGFRSRAGRALNRLSARFLKEKAAAAIPFPPDPFSLAAAAASEGIFPARRLWRRALAFFRNF
ncbi:MAG: hypothetical protein WC919_05325 [Candidatus Paceibacterota bacterium]|nr:hypothetical protein [Candidatus Paceibacterota bacterium]